MEIVYKSGSPAVMWKPALQRVYALFGEEDRLKEEAVAALTKHVVEPDFADFDMETLDAGTHTADDILASLAQAPFGSERRFVVVKGMELWRERGKNAEAERLAEGIEPAIGRDVPGAGCGGGGRGRAAQNGGNNETG